VSVPRPSPTASPVAVAAARTPWRRHVALASVLYLIVALWALRPVLPHPTTALPYPTMLAALKGGWLELSWNDQMLTTALTTQNARRMLTAPWRLFDNRQCYPTPRPAALGEHMFGMGLRGVIPYALTRSPVLTTNVALLSTFWLAGMAMYALVAFWTGNPWAALVAGLLFAFQPTRLTNVIHPYVEANEWTVIALLAAHLLFTRATWASAALLAGALSLQMLESFYPILGMTVLGGTYGLYLMVRYWRRLPVLAPKLLAVAGVVAGVAAMIFVPYLHTREVWGTAVGGRSTLLYQLHDFGRGGQAYPGTVTVVLALVALADRLRRRRDGGRGYDPRLPLLVAGLAVMWASILYVPLPFGASVPSLYHLASGIVPGLDSIRGGAAISRGVAISATFLAGYGAFVLLERRSPRARVLLAAALVAAGLANVFVPALAAREFGAPVTMGAHQVRPPQEVVALYDRLPPGPVLDVPFDYTASGILKYMPHYVFLVAYHHHAVGACYNSFVVRVQEDIGTLVSRLPDPAAVDALAALGFRSLVIHEEMLRRGDSRFAALTAIGALRQRPDPATIHLEPLGNAAGHTAYAFHPPGATTTSIEALANDQPANGVMGAKPPRVDVYFSFRNGASAIYHHPQPIEPSWLLLRWRAAGGALVREDRIREMLPLALAPSQGLLRKITVPITVGTGEYDVTLSPADVPDLVLSRRRLAVSAPPAGS
jgi:hypothetical protein